MISFSYIFPHQIINVIIYTILTLYSLKVAGKLLYSDIKKQKLVELEEIRLEKEKISKERERIYTTSKQETKRIVADKLVEAEEIIDSLKKTIYDNCIKKKLYLFVNM